MKCEDAQLLMMDSLMGESSPDDRQALDEHLEGCSLCSTELAAMESMWRELGEADQLRKGSDSDRMNRRFRQTLAEFEADLDLGQRPTFSEWWINLWAARPVWQVGFSTAVLGCGVLVGLAVSSQQTSSWRDRRSSSGSRIDESRGHCSSSRRIGN